MKITSNEPLILDELFNDLKRDHIKVEKETQYVEGSMAIGETVSLILDSIDKILNILTFFINQKNYYIHIKLKDGREIKFNDLSEEKQQQEFEAIKDNGDVLFLEIGRK